MCVWCSPCRQPDDALAPLLFDVAAGTLYLSVVSRLIGIIYTTPVPSRAVGAMIVRGSPALVVLMSSCSGHWLVALSRSGCRNRSRRKGERGCRVMVVFSRPFDA